ncbi:outer membrane protein assembly factor BamE [Hymenobacter sp. HDW8]|uniref:outer membrane protein assembly factor BamE n=1 Tax=Hymenobacter sp. HDW8 TaxID=2714932 RepID=UPI00140D46DB|nr:outer membrane protein assembly factor BamE [Hymenobacter sp. HDW8]QIL78136.1 outer membrane protein assembly factor BamE [Hymenobacter sp. HDW8]
MPERKYSSAFSLGLEIDSADYRLRAERKRKENIRSKYEEAVSDKLIDRKIETGMTREQVLDSFGEPTKTERVLTKAGERETLIYGSKSAGSYFHIMDGVITKAVVR